MAASIAVVTKRAGLTLTMNSATHRFHEVRPVTDWLDRHWSEQVIVLDLETAEAALTAIETLHRSGVDAPVIVIASDSDGWDELLSLYPALSFVSLPIMPTALLSAIDRAVRQAEIASAPSGIAYSIASALLEESKALGEPAPAPENVASQSSQPVELSPMPPPRGSGTEVAPPIDEPPIEDRQIAEPPIQTGAEPRPPKPHAPSLDGAIPVREAARAAPEPVAGSDQKQIAPPTQERSQSPNAAVPASAVPKVAPETRPAGVPGRKADPQQVAMALVRSLLLGVGRLGRVHEVAEVLRQRCASSVACDASAVLVPDGDVWRVAAGEHLRPLEERLQIGSDHWLAMEVVAANHGLIIQNTDIARTRLSGAPLASWPNLMALPVPPVGALVLLARQDDGFGRKDLSSLRQELEVFGREMQDAVDVRELARRMIDFVDPVD